MKAFQRLIEKYYGTPVLPSLPVSFQEAVILLAEKDVDYWKRFNVSGNVIRKFAGYRNLVVQNRNNPQLPQLIKKSFERHLLVLLYSKMINNHEKEIFYISPVYFLFY